MLGSRLLYGAGMILFKKKYIMKKRRRRIKLKPDTKKSKSKKSTKKRVTRAKPKDPIKY